LGNGFEGGEEAAETGIDEPLVIDGFEAGDALGARFGWEFELHDIAGGDIHMTFKDIEGGAHGGA